MNSRATKSNSADKNLRVAAEWCPTGIVMFDNAGTILLANLAAEKLLQYGRGELSGKPIEILIPHRYRAGSPNGQKKIYDSAQAFPLGKGGEFCAVRKDGAEMSVEIGLNSVPMHNGRTAVVAAIVDISDRKRGDKNKDEFVATVSHELRTPLTSIAASLGLLVADSTGNRSDAAKRLLKIAHGNSQRLVRLINDILDIEKIESGKVEFHMRRLNLRSLVEQTIEDNRAFADQFEVTVKFDPESIDACVRADFDRLTQVVTNLVSNAVKFSPAGSEVLLSVSSVGGNIRIAVCDRGPGIPEEFRAHVFERFAQAESAEVRQKNGTGLGLSIVKEIVSRLGGEAGFEPAIGGGTIFYVDLPPYEEGAENADGTHILLCSDDPGTAPLVCRKLHEAGFNVDVAFSADEAVRGSSTRNYAAIVVDLQLSDSNGTALIKQLRTQWNYQNKPMIVVSADPSRTLVDEHPAICNVLDWLSQPLDVERLGRILSRPIVRDAHQRPRILHFDGNQEVLGHAAESLKVSCEVFSATSIGRASRTLAERQIDFAVIELNSAGAEFVLELLPCLRDSKGNPIPVVFYSPLDRSSEIAARFVAGITKSPVSINGVITCLRRLVTSKPSIVPVRDVA